MGQAQFTFLYIMKNLLFLSPSSLSSQPVKEFLLTNTMNKKGNSSVTLRMMTDSEKGIQNTLTRIYISLSVTYVCMCTHTHTHTQNTIPVQIYSIFLPLALA